MAKLQTTSSEVRMKNSETRDSRVITLCTEFLGSLVRKFLNSEFQLLNSFVEKRTSKEE